MKCSLATKPAIHATYQTNQTRPYALVKLHPVTSGCKWLVSRNPVRSLNRVPTRGKKRKPNTIHPGPLVYTSRQIGPLEAFGKLLALRVRFAGTQAGHVPVLQNRSFHLTAKQQSTSSPQPIHYSHQQYKKLLIHRRSKYATSQSIDVYGCAWTNANVPTKKCWWYFSFEDNRSVIFECSVRSNFAKLEEKTLINFSIIKLTFFTRCDALYWIFLRFYNCF